MTEAFILSGFREHGSKELDTIIVLGAQVYEKENLIDSR